MTALTGLIKGIFDFGNEKGRVHEWQGKYW